MAERLLIERLGARADGIADDGTFVPKALPGETVAVERDGKHGRLVAVEDASPDRVEPFCPYFTACGGCATQHMAEPTYRAWKRGLVVEALSRAGLQTEVAPLIDAHGAGRRRITLHARRTGSEVAVGFMAPRTHELVPITHCPVSEPGLREAGVAAARTLASVIGGAKPLDLQVTLTEAGLDIDLRGLGPLEGRRRLALTEAADRLDLARLSLHGEVMVERRPPVLRMGPAGVVPPPGGFLQATAAGEQALAGLVVDALAGAKRAADLFAGCGPFSLRLAAFAEVHAVEQEASGLAALDRAARGTPGLRRVTTERRDLFRRPLLAPELARFDAVVLDPPRAGAEAQVRQLAASPVPVVASVSCDPVTFARDAGQLTGGGYRLERVVPVDQFKHTAHVEIVGLFRRLDAKRRR